MFKKAVEAKSHQRLSGADRKKLKRNLRDKFPRASDADLDVLLPPKAEITVAKFQNRVQVYGIEGGLPMVFDIDGRGTEIYPTVFALWKVPELLPSFMLKGGEVSRYIIGGADLMFPGISIPVEGLPSFLAGEPWAVKVPGNPAPIAVGATTMSSTEALKAGLRGKALRITHYYRDFLWESVEGHYVPNTGFLEDVVFEDPVLVSSSQGLDSCEDAADASEDPENNIKNEEEGESEPNTVSTTEIDAKSGMAEEAIANVGDIKLEDDASANETNVEEPLALSVEDVDAYLDKCLLQALHTTVKDKDLPMPGSTLWSNHVLPCRPSNVTLDIKKSSHKKLSKWLQAKASVGLIAVKEDKHKKEVVLFSVNRNHPDYLSFKPEIRKVEKSDQVGDHATSENRSQKMLEVTEIYKPSVHVNPIFASVGADGGRLYSASEASEIVFKYVEKENLVKPTNKSIVVLDPTLCDALFKGAIKKGSAYPTEIHKKDLGSAFIGRMQAHHVVTRGTDSVVRKGAIKTIQIMTERRQGNKKVTRVSGTETFLIDAEPLASELQKKFACSTSVAELPGKKGQEVLIQGGVIDDVAKHLVGQYGIPKRYIEVLDKTRK
ncbi:eukaryotic translation initiation factor 2D isoform X1 [Carica papaya]|uniref:eukaryotic translation initiation factor 2D isoform X1 n=1 Tax=Carica papaya TaxID=3649 RepID=UPI000B8CBE1E|nr:eukaryotic translation initiation factor 2D isoform X1 [Carica papaya]XP_021889611.1 eukaryotic translation initiation factor 2D isoform X1 [Carica papaya]XP_021889612.1 eukaryotic translation initiation factor 2D isoform X1 [Carica papaya]